jgi:hypothetical protein
MIILNFSHPLTEEQKREIQALTGQRIQEIREIPVKLDHNKSFKPQVAKLIESCNLSPEEWQTLPILIVPPSLNFVALSLFAALHGLMGYFPPIVRIKPVEDSVPPGFEVAEVINLQEIRERFRERR